MSSRIAARSWLVRWAVCVFLLAASFVLFPLLALALSGSSEAAPLLPRQVRNVLFFWPQYFLLLGGIEDRVTGARHLVGLSTVFSIAVWLTFLAGYAWITRPLRIVYVLLGLFPAVATVLELLLAVGLRAAGFAAVMDGL